ncbi:hypothetical protein MMC29_002440 [Sticta canariensis]|nr:hypothetical protein [Sticta canariensis]
MANQNQNLFILAADNNANLLPLLRSNHSLASSQDPHGYSVLHASASYGHLDLIRKLINEFHVDVNIKDEDGETPLFVVETVDAAQVLVDELGADLMIKNHDGMTAEEKFQTDGDFPTITAFLRESRLHGNTSNPSTDEVNSNQQSESLFSNDVHPPPLPPNVTVNVGMMNEPSADGDTDVDPEFKERIAALAARDDFQGEDGQRELRELITDAVRGSGNARDDRSVRQRIE